MAEQYRKDFIIGGLPLSSDDFIDPSKAREKKNNLLAALDNINRVHEKKMKVDNTTISSAQNFDAVGITLDMLDKENSNSITQPETKKDEYIFDSQIIRGSNPLPAAQSSTQSKPLFDLDNAQPLFENDMTNTEPMANIDPMPEFAVDEGTPFEQAELNNTQDNSQTFDQGEPMFVLDDSQVGKKAKGKKRGEKSKNSCSPEQIKSGKGVAWMAYILFFLPLLFNGKNAFVRHHANEGVELNILDVIGVGLLLAAKFVKVSNTIVNTVLMVGSLLGLLIIMITTVTKVFLIIFSIAGKEASTPFFGKLRIIK